MNKTNIAIKASSVLAVMLFVNTLTFGANSHLQSDTIFNSIKEKIIKLVEQNKIPSLSVAVAKNGTVIWKESFGWADKAKGLKATPETIYTVGSMSKSITATGLMILVERGMVDLDEPVNTYLAPAKLTVYEGDPEEVTVRRLLNCTAAIPHGWFGYYHQDDLAVLNYGEYIEQFGMVVYPAGSTFLYSNHAYGIVAKIIENVSGMSYQEFMKTELFAPLGMINTMSVFPNLLPDQLGNKYLRNGTSLEPGTITGPVEGAGLHASLDDILKYGLFNSKRGPKKWDQILKPSSLDSMHFSMNHNNPYWSMALGWWNIKLDKSTNWLISNGEVTGGNASLSIIPSEEIVVACLANIATQPSISDEISFEILELLHPGFMEKLGEVMGAYEENTSKAYTPDSELQGSWKGKMENSEGTTPISIVFQEDGDIHIDIENQFKTLLSNVHYEHDILMGTCYGMIPTEKDMEPGYLEIHLMFDKQRLFGYVSSIQSRNPSFDANPMSYVSMAHIELSKSK